MSSKTTGMGRMSMLNTAETFQMAIENHKAGRLSEAQRLYLKVLQKCPHHSDANHNLGVISIQVGKPDLGLNNLKAAVKHNPANGQYWISFMKALIMTSRMDAAKNLIDEAIKAELPGDTVHNLLNLLAHGEASLNKQNDNPAIDFISYITLREAGKYSEAQAWLEKQFQANSRSPELFAHYAHILLFRQKIKDAEDAIQKALKLNPALPVVQLNLARLLLFKNRIKDALSAAQRAYQSAPQNPEHRLVLASMLGADDQMDKALILIDSVIQNNPDYAEAYAQRAFFMYKQGKTQQSLADAHKALAMKPWLSKLRAITIDIHIRTRNYQAAIKALEKALNLEPDNVDFMAVLGEMKRKTDNLKEALIILEKATELAPNHANALINFGTALQEMGQINKARQAYEKAMAIKPKSAEIANNLGYLAKEVHDWSTALAYFEKAVSLQPERVEFYPNLATALSETGRFDEAEAMARKAVSKDPNYMEGHLSLAGCLWNVGKAAESLGILKKAISRFPDSGEPLFRYAENLKEIGDMENAEKYALAGIEKTNRFAKGFFIWSSVRQFKVKEQKFAKLESFLKEKTATLKDKLLGHYALGKMYADLKEYDLAFDHYKMANSYRKKVFAKEYDHQEDRNKLLAARKIFIADYFSDRKQYANPADTPIFIVGMPRSGTTLLEQILGSHSTVYAAGELPFLKSLLSAIGSKGMSESQNFMETGRHLSFDSARNIADLYLKKTSALAEKMKVTDKMPHNFELLWLIALIFPDATIIHSRRNPVDTCLSCYFQNFTKPHLYKNDLQSLGLHYRYYRDLMDYWKKVLPCNIHDIIYEEMVADPEAQVKKLLAACDLEFEPDCLNFYQAERSVRTASAYQVRQKIYASSVHKWRRYEKHLGPLLETLGDYQDW